jgi:hypothetical protein
MSELQLQNIGDTNINKGFIDGKTIIAWDTIASCKAKECMVYDRCSYLKRGKCGVQIAYVTTLTSTIMSRYKFLDELSLFKIGTHIIPLYSQLCKMKILEMALETVDIIDEKGRILIHPVYKAIRETLTTITIMWRDLDITIRGGDFDSDLPLTAATSKSGDSSYYDTLSLSVEKRELTR